MKPTFERTAATGLLVTFLAKAQIGATITKSELMDAAHVDRSDPKSVRNFYGHLHSAFRIMRREHKRSFGNIHGVGYMMLDDSGIVGKVASVLPRMHRQAYRAIRESELIDSGKLAPDKRFQNSATVAALGAIENCTRSMTVKRLEARAAKSQVRLDVGDVVKELE